MQNKKGISLIVLVITIIVMIILAASVVISLNNTGVIDKASQAVGLTNEQQVQDLASLIWADAYMNEYRDEELIYEVTTKLSEQGVTSDKWKIEISNTGISVSNKQNENVYEEYNHDALELHHAGIIPEGGRFVHEAAGVVTINGILTTDNTSYELGPGDQFPEQIMLKDTYYYGDYMYTMKDCDFGNAALYPPNGTYNQVGWRVEAVDKTKETYDPILESICGINITSVFKAFYGCANMVESPVIPQYANELFVGVYNGTKIGNFPKGILPDGIGNFYNSTLKTFTTNIEYIYFPESLTTISHGTINEMISVSIKTLCISCKTTYTPNTVMPAPISKAPAEEIIYYHHSTCDGTCGK